MVTFLWIVLVFFSYFLGKVNTLKQVTVIYKELVKIPEVREWIEKQKEK